MDTASEAPAGIAFGRFLLLPHRRELLADGRPVKLGGRAFEALVALIEARGAMVSKHALMARVWPDRIVEENNLQWQISALRTAFGADRNLIRTVSGRGYQFTGEIGALSANPKAGAATAIADAPPDARESRRNGGIPGELPPTNLPEPVSELVGRDDVLGEILSLASAHRLVTLTGAGGIGKTRLAIAAARQLLPQFSDGVWLAEFSPIPASCPSPLPRRSVSILAAAKSRRSACRGRSPADGWCSCLTLASTSSALQRGWPRPCCKPAGACASSPPAASRCGRKASGSIRCRRSPCRRKIPRTPTICCAAAGFGYLSNGYARPSRILRRTGAMQR
jgi:DNA-binding winged helix-turn-helix (wHTH) protein